MKQKTGAVILVIITTFLTSVAQILYKIGADKLTISISGILLNYHLTIGIVLYMLGSVLLILAFRKGEVSILFPIVATSYIWVLILSTVFLNEQMNILKILGILFIIFGISIINLKSSAAKYVEGA